MTALQARVRRFIADRPAATATDREVYGQFARLARGTVYRALLALGNAGYLVVTEAGTRWTARAPS